MKIYNFMNNGAFLAWLELNYFDPKHIRFDDVYIDEYQSPGDVFLEPGRPNRVYYVMNERKSGFYVFDAMVPGQNLDELHPRIRFLSRHQV